MAVDLAIVAPLFSEASGGYLAGLRALVPRWQASRRVRTIELHVPDNVLPDADSLGVPVRRYSTRPRTFRPFEPAVRRTGEEVVLSTASRPIGVSGSPVVTIVRNVEPIQSATYPMPWMWRLRLAFLRRETTQACRQATRVIAVSGYTIECLTALGVPASKIDLAYHGADPPAADSSRPACLASVGTGFLFTAGSLVPYRGFEDVIRALAILRHERDGAVPRVVIAGSGGGLARPYERSIRALPGALGVSDHVIWAGQLSPSEMSWCFNHAAAVIQTSRAESFSIFQAEALQAGAWIIACDRPPMPEILGGAAQYYEAGDASGLARAISLALALTPRERDDRRVAAIERGACFTWQREAEAVLDALEAARREFRA